MKSSYTAKALGAALVTLVASTSAAEECTELLAPASTSLRDTGLDLPRVACGGDTISVGARAFVLLDEPDFYGTLSSSLFVEYRTLHETGFEFAIGARVLDYRFAQSAVFQADEFSFGPVHLHVLRPDKRNWFGKPVVLSHALRVEVPYTNSSDDHFTVAASPSILATMFLAPQMHLHGRLAGLLWSTLPESGADSRAALLSSVDFAYAPLAALSLLVGAEVQGGWYGLGLDHVQARAGLRIAAGAGGAVELSAGTALAGEERADLVTWIGYRRTAQPKTQVKPSRLLDWAR